MAPVKDLKSLNDEELNIEYEKSKVKAGKEEGSVNWSIHLDNVVLEMARRLENEHG